MADTYGVTAADIAAELPGIFPGGFSASTKPSDTLVESWISDADVVVGLKVQDIAGQPGASTDKAAVLAKRWIKETVKGQAVRAAYAGNDPLAVKAAAEPYENSAAFTWDAIIALDSQIIGTGEAASRVGVPYTSTQRELLVTDAQLDDDAGFRERRF